MATANAHLTTCVYATATGSQMIAASAYACSVLRTSIPPRLVHIHSPIIQHFLDPIIYSPQIPNVDTISIFHSQGDLDMSGSLSGPMTLVVENSPVYPYGTSEVFPQMEDSYQNVQTDTAHYYMECSNKGSCTRATGECLCYQGYEGVACQRASCPGTPGCSGHGVCMSIKQLAYADNYNSYELWDKDSTMGCSCDGGYYGADCSQRRCKFGVDPLYLDDSATVKYSVYDFATFTTSPYLSDFSGGDPTQNSTGTWAIRFYDNVGEDWLTGAIKTGATCDDVVSALEALPNKVIPSGTIDCSMVSRANGDELSAFSYGYENTTSINPKHRYKKYYNMAIWDVQTGSDQGEYSRRDTVTPDYLSSAMTQSHTAEKISGYIYRLKFYGNPGAFQQPEIELHLDGARPSIISAGSEKIVTKVWTDGQQGENQDYFADHCDGVTINIGVTSGKHYLTSFTVASKNLLKACLGSADFNLENNRDVYNWDHGSKLYPHLIKLVRTVTTYMDGGYYAALYFDTTISLDNVGGLSTGTFRLLNPFTPPDGLLTDSYEVYTTKGTFALTSNLSEATFGFGSRSIYTTNTSYEINPYGNPYDGDISCEISTENPDKFNYINHCLNTSDLFTMLSFENQAMNPPHLNLYTAKRVHTLPFDKSVIDKFTPNPTALLYPNSEAYTAAIQGASSTRYLTHVITSDLSANWGVSVKYHPMFHIYKFFPAVASTYEYVAECSNRGLCDSTGLGTCTCFPGYTSDACSEQSSLSL